MPSSPKDGVPIISIFSMNCWGLKFISKHRTQRLTEISSRIAAAIPSYDIVALQEFWVHSDYLTLRSHTSSILPYGKFYFSGALGGGLVILSKYPFRESSMFRYPLNGRPTAFHRGDWYVGKGVACASLQHPSGAVIDVFNTHLHAPYEEVDTYLCHRTAQAWEISKLLRGAVEKGHVAIGLGDFNMIPTSLAHRVITTTGKVADSWPAPPATSVDDANIAKHNINVLGATCDSILNTWRLPKGLAYPPPADTPDPYAKRLDYIFHSPSNSSVLSAKVGMTEPLSQPTFCSLSDHFSVEVELALTHSPQTPQLISVSPTTPSPGAVGSTRAEESHLAGNTGQVPGERALPEHILDEIEGVRKEYYQREEKEYNWRITHFWVSVVLLVACHVAVWWSPHNGVAFALMMVGWVVAVTGVLDGLIGFLFTGSEIRAMREFGKEIEMYREVNHGTGKRREGGAA